MYSKSIVASIVLLAIASPAFAAPVKVEARFSKGAPSPNSDSGVLTDDALAGLLAILGKGQNVPRRNRDLEARGFLGDLLSKLVSGGEQTIEGLIKNALVGGNIAGRDLEARGALKDLLSKLFAGGEQTLEDLLKGALCARDIGKGAISPVLPDGAPAASVPDASLPSNDTQTLPAGQPAESDLPVPTDVDDSCLPAGAPADKLAGAGEQSIESLIKGALGRIGGRGFITNEVESLAEKGIGAIIPKLFGKRALADLDDDEVITLLKYVSDKNIKSKRGFITSEAESLAEKGMGAIISKLFMLVLPFRLHLWSVSDSKSSKRALADLDDDEVITLLKYLSEKNTNSKRGFFTNGVLPLAEKGIGAIISKLNSSFDNWSSSHYSKRALADLDDDEVITLLKYVSAKNSQSKRALADLSDDEVVTLLEYVASSHGKREMSLNDLD
ncbi:hypothetical protein B0H13DRAFT_2261460 [Mycena leptocephala]|nr:hypothetical protein B0H13DRAFT_2261460 [Mycena leptocephala]